MGNSGDCLDTGATFSVTNSKSWKITEPQIKCDIVMLDSELQNSYASHLLSGKALPIHFSTYATNVHTATGKDSSLSMARSFTRLKSVFVIMFHGDGTDTQTSCQLLLPPNERNLQQECRGWVPTSTWQRCVPTVAYPQLVRGMLQSTQSSWYYKRWQHQYQQTGFHV